MYDEGRRTKDEGPINAMGAAGNSLLAAVLFGRKRKRSLQLLTAVHAYMPTPYFFTYCTVVFSPPPCSSLATLHGTLVCNTYDSSVAFLVLSSLERVPTVRNFHADQAAPQLCLRFTFAPRAAADPSKSLLLSTLVGIVLHLRRVS